MKDIVQAHQTLLESQVQTFCTCWWLGLNFRNPDITRIERGKLTTVVCNHGHGLRVGDACILKGVRGLIAPGDQAGVDPLSLSKLNDNAHAGTWALWQVLSVPDPFTILINTNTAEHSEYESGGIVRKVQTYTDHISPIELDGTVYRSDFGYQPTSTETASSGAIDTVSIQGFMPRVTSDSDFNEGDILSGAYDNAELRMFMIDYTNPTAGRTWLRRGFLGEVQIGNEQYEAEVQSLVGVLGQPTLNLYSAECRHDFGDAGCRVVPAFQYSSIYSEPFAQDNLVGTFIRGEVEVNLYGEPIPGSPADRFKYGSMRFLTGLNQGIELPVDRTFPDTIAELLETAKPVADYSFPAHPGAGATQQELDDYAARQIEYEALLFELIVDDRLALPGTQIMDEIPTPDIQYEPLPPTFLYMPTFDVWEVWPDVRQVFQQSLRLGYNQFNTLGLDFPGPGDNQGGELFLLDFKESYVDGNIPARLGSPYSSAFHYLVRRQFQLKAPCVPDAVAGNEDQVYAAEVEGKLFGIKSFAYQSNVHGQIKRVARNQLRDSELIYYNEIELAISQGRPYMLVKYNPDGHFEALSDFMKYRFEIPVIVNVPVLSTAKSNASASSESQTNNAQPPTDPGPVTPPDHADVFATSRLGTAADGFGDGDFLFTLFPEYPTDTQTFNSGDVIDVLVDAAFPYGNTSGNLLTHNGITKVGIPAIGAATSLVNEAVTVGYDYSTIPFVAGDIVRIDRTSTHTRVIGINVRSDGVTQEQVDQYILDLLIFNASQGVPPVDPGALNPANVVAAYFDAQHIPGTDTFMAISPDDSTSNLFTEFGDEAQLDLKLPSVFDSALNPTDNVELSQFRKAASSGSASITRELREAVLVGSPGSGALILANDPRIFPGAIIRVEIQGSVFSLIGEGLYISEEDAVTQADIDAYQDALTAYNDYLAAQEAAALLVANTEPPNQKITRRENTNTLLEPVEDVYRAQLIAELQAAELYDIVVLRFDGDYIGDYALLLEDENGDVVRYDLCQPWNGEAISAEAEGHCFRIDKAAVQNGDSGVLQILDDRIPVNSGFYPNPAPACFDHPVPYEGTIPDEPVLQGTKTLLDFNAESTGVAPPNFVDAGVPYSGAAIPSPILVNNVDTDFGDNYVQLILAVGRKYFIYTGGSEHEDSAVATQVKTTVDQFNRQPSVVLRANSQRLVELRFANQFQDLELWDVAVPTGAETIRARVDVSDIVLPDTIYQIWLRAAGNRCFFALRQVDETVLRSGEGLTLTTVGRPGVGVTVSEF